MGVSLKSIIASMCLAVLHVVLEFGYLAIEAKATKTSFLNYCVACFNGRFNWVPYTDFMQEFAKENDEIELDFEHIQTNLMCFETEVDFHFTNNTIKCLAKSLAMMKRQDKKKLNIYLKFGSTLAGVSFENLKTLLKLANERVYIDLEGVELSKLQAGSIC